MMSPEEIGAILKELRKRAGYESLGQLGKDSGVTVATLSRVESGVHRPTPDTLKKLAPFLRVTPEYLMQAAGFLPGFTGKLPNIEARQRRVTDPAEEHYPEVLKILRRNPKKLTLEDRKKLAKLMKDAIEIFPDRE